MRPFEPVVAEHYIFATTGSRGTRSWSLHSVHALAETTRRHPVCSEWKHNTTLEMLAHEVTKRIQLLFHAQMCTAKALGWQNRVSFGPALAPRNICRKRLKTVGHETNAILVIWSSWEMYDRVGFGFVKMLSKPQSICKQCDPSMSLRWVFADCYVLQGNFHIPLCNRSTHKRYLIAYSRVVWRDQHNVSMETHYPWVNHHRKHDAPMFSSMNYIIQITKTSNLTHQLVTCRSTIYYTIYCRPFVSDCIALWKLLVYVHTYTSLSS